MIRASRRCSISTVLKLSPDILRPLGGKPSSPFKAKQFRIFSRVWIQLHLGQNRSLSEKGWTTELLKKVAVQPVHFSLRRQKMRVSAALVLLFTSALNAGAAWVEKTARSENSPAAGLVHRQVELEDSSTGQSATVELAIFSPKSCQLRLVDNRDGASNLPDAMQAGNFLAGVNGGYFDPTFAPIGLRIIEGKIIRPLVHARLLTGVLISSRDFTQIVRAGEYAKVRRNPYSAVQCGPVLVDASRAVKGLNAARIARRTFAVVGNDRAAVGFCSEVSLAQLSQILVSARLADDFKVQRGLNLDGGSSSAFWFKRDRGVFSIPEQKMVRDFVAVVPR
jgi:uncharacterized protein YigE (DUF2233 family)